MKILNIIPGVLVLTLALLGLTYCEKNSNESMGQGEGSETWTEKHPGLQCSEDWECEPPATCRELEGLEGEAVGLSVCSLSRPAGSDCRYSFECSGHCIEGKCSGEKEPGERCSQGHRECASLICQCWERFGIPTCRVPVGQVIDFTPDEDIPVCEKGSLPAIEFFLSDPENLVYFCMEVECVANRDCEGGNVCREGFCVEEDQESGDETLQ